MKNKIIYLLLIAFVLTMSAGLISCNNATNIISDVISNKVTAKDRLDSANAQATRRYGSSAKLLLVLGQNVLFDGTDRGRTEMTILNVLTDPNTLGAWVYVYKKPGTDTLAVFTPNPTPGARDCIELTKFFSTNTLIGLISDTSARNIVQGAISVITSTNLNITTPTSLLVDSDVSLGYANNTNPVIKFNSSFIPSSSTLNGASFLLDSTTGLTKTVNMFLIPGAGTLNLPAYITQLTGFPADLWVVNYKKTVGYNTSNLILGTVVQSSQNMGIPFLTLLSKCINLSKFVNQ